MLDRKSGDAAEFIARENLADRVASELAVSHTCGEAPQEKVLRLTEAC
jgi:hypothetical protein